MPILDERVERYVHGLRPERLPVMAEMEAVAERDGVPIVHWETSRFLATLCRALDPVVLEVGTAIGYSTLHMAEQLTDGRVITLWGEVALPAGAETRWRPETLAAARKLNADLMRSERWLACVLPVGDGIAVATRR